MDMWQGIVDFYAGVLRVGNPRTGAVVVVFFVGVPNWFAAVIVDFLLGVVAPTAPTPSLSTSFL